eukprot:TRINITY_DN809_c0_g1_i1.p1 TRINITY_DN809_c0_g1~~TRINITY_DN809_c0_g1_i1.p1  ORF type:complete len:1518 (-),score=309.55 TRINITY_DN809_c0_g1_i1:56-4609(-)
MEVDGDLPVYGPSARPLAALTIQRWWRGVIGRWIARDLRAQRMQMERKLADTWSGYARRRVDIVEEDRLKRWDAFLRAELVERHAVWKEEQRFRAAISKVIADAQADMQRRLPLLAMLSHESHMRKRVMQERDLGIARLVELQEGIMRQWILAAKTADLQRNSRRLSQELTQALSQSLRVTESTERAARQLLVREEIDVRRIIQTQIVREEKALVGQAQGQLLRKLEEEARSALTALEHTSRWKIHADLRHGTAAAWDRTKKAVISEEEEARHEIQEEQGDMARAILEALCHTGMLNVRSLETKAWSRLAALQGFLAKELRLRQDLAAEERARRIGILSYVDRVVTTTEQRRLLVADELKQRAELQRAFKAEQFQQLVQIITTLSSAQSAAVQKHEESERTKLLNAEKGQQSVIALLLNEKTGRKTIEGSQIGPRNLLEDLWATTYAEHVARAAAVGQEMQQRNAISREFLIYNLVLRETANRTRLQQQAQTDATAIYLRSVPYEEYVYRLYRNTVEQQAGTKLMTQAAEERESLLQQLEKKTKALHKTQRDTLCAREQDERANLQEQETQSRTNLLRAFDEGETQILQAAEQRKMREAAARAALSEDEMKSRTVISENETFLHRLAKSSQQLQLEEMQTRLALQKTTSSARTGLLSREQLERLPLFESGARAAINKEQDGQRGLLSRSEQSDRKTADQAYLSRRKAEDQADERAVLREAERGERELITQHARDQFHWSQLHELEEYEQLMRREAERRERRLRMDIEDFERAQMGEVQARQVAAVRQKMVMELSAKRAEALREWREQQDRADRENIRALVAEEEKGRKALQSEWEDQWHEQVVAVELSQLEEIARAKVQPQLMSQFKEQFSLTAREFTVVLEGDKRVQIRKLYSTGFGNLQLAALISQEQIGRNQINAENSTERVRVQRHRELQVGAQQGHDSIVAMEKSSRPAVELLATAIYQKRPILWLETTLRTQLQALRNFFVAESKERSQLDQGQKNAVQQLKQQQSMERIEIEKACLFTAEDTARKTMRTAETTNRVAVNVQCALEGLVIREREARKETNANFLNTWTTQCVEEVQAQEVIKRAAISKQQTNTTEAMRRAAATSQREVALISSFRRTGEAEDKERKEFENDEERARQELITEVAVIRGKSKALADERYRQKKEQATMRVHFEGEEKASRRTIDSEEQEDFIDLVRGFNQEVAAIQKRAEEASAYTKQIDELHKERSKLSLAKRRSVTEAAEQPPQSPGTPQKGGLVGKKRSEWLKHSASAETPRAADRVDETPQTSARRKQVPFDEPFSSSIWDRVGLRPPVNAPRQLITSLPSSYGQSCRSVYLYYCEQYQVTPKLPILDALPKRIGDFSILQLHVGLLDVPMQVSSYIVMAPAVSGSRGILPILEVCRLCPNLHTLGLRGAGLQNSSVEWVVQMALTHPALATIDVSDNRISAPAGVLLAHLVAKNPRIVTIDAENTYLPAKQLIQLREALLANNGNPPRSAAGTPLPPASPILLPALR